MLSHASSYKHLLKQPAFEGLGEGDLAGHAFDLAVEGGEEVGDFGLFGDRRRHDNSRISKCVLAHVVSSAPSTLGGDLVPGERRAQQEVHEQRMKLSLGLPSNDETPKSSGLPLVHIDICLPDVFSCLGASVEQKIAILHFKF